jgi:hypothetical protein
MGWGEVMVVGRVAEVREMGQIFGRMKRYRDLVSLES